MEKQEIKERILEYYEPGNIKDYDMYIEIDDFVNLFAPIDQIKLSDLEEALQELGFKNEECRIDLMFLVKRVDNN